jgi:16S rRNA (adenine1518-N6/adenine1519-N6)-dimethyltransferase
MKRDRRRLGERSERAASERETSAARARAKSAEAPSAHDASSPVVGRTRATWDAMRRELDEAGFRPARRLGQNFLLDENMLRAIVRDAELPEDASVIEVGAGCGFLTVHLARSGADVTSIEIDPRLLAIARRWLAGERVRWIQGDALSSKNALGAELDAAIPRTEPWHLVANLPYSIAAPLLVLLAQHACPPTSMTVLVQREVALRIVARPGTPDWGPLSIRLQLDYAPTLVRSVAAALFWPRPEVESCVVRLTRLPDTTSADERAELDRLVSRLFQRRRQALGRVLAEVLHSRPATDVLLAELGLAPRARAEDLELETLRRLSRAVSDRGAAES